MSTKIHFVKNKFKSLAFFLICRYDIFQNKKGGDPF